jgi:hypothetical protein
MAYPQVQGNTLIGSSQPSTLTYSIPDSPAQSTTGIASALQNLAAEVQSTNSLAYKVRGALGISAPEPEVGKEGPQPSSLLEVLAAFRRTLIRANQDFETVINHINS